MIHNYMEVAKNLVEKGISVTPVKDKKPFLKDWQNLIDDKILEPKYEKSWKQANGLGIILGEPSGLICLDIDILEIDENRREIREELLKMLPPPYCGLVGNPKKPPAILFKYNGERSEKFIALSVEILSNGNQKLIPPSINPVSKSEYKYVGNDLNSVDPDDFPDMPVEILEYLRFKNSDISGHIETETNPGDLEKGRCRHNSHNILSQHGVKLFYQGWVFEEIVDKLLDFDKEINSEADFNYFKCPSRSEFRTKNERVNAMQFVGEIFLRNSHKKYSRTDFFQEELANGFTWRDPENPKQKPIRQFLALFNYLKARRDPWYCPEMRTFYIWDGKKYDTKIDDMVRKFAQDHFKNPACTLIGDKSTFLDYAKNVQQCGVDDFLMTDKELINLKNGIYNLQTKKLQHHARKHRMTYLIDVPWVENGNPSMWDILLKLITKNRDHMQTAIEEFIGYAISCCKYQKFNKLMILDGGGANGKSTLIRVIQGLIGLKNTASVSLDSITQERFSGFSLVNKLINFCAEEPKEAFANTGVIKKITGGDSIMVEEKHKGSFQYSNLAKLIISYNKMPFFPDDSSGMKRRIILIPCEMDFIKNPEMKLNNPEAHIYENERPQVLYRCVQAYLKVIERGHFTEVSEGVDRLDEMITESNPIYSFIQDCVKVTGDKDHWEPVGGTYGAFVNYQGGHSRIHKNTFCKRFLAKLNEDFPEKVTAYVKRDDLTSTTFRAYKGIKITE